MTFYHEDKIFRQGRKQWGQKYDKDEKFIAIALLLTNYYMTEYYFYFALSTFYLLAALCNQPFKFSEQVCPCIECAMDCSRHWGFCSAYHCYILLFSIGQFTYWVLLTTKIYICNFTCALRFKDWIWILCYVFSVFYSLYYLLRSTCIINLNKIRFFKNEIATFFQGTAFVKFASAESAEKCMAASETEGIFLDGRQVQSLNG